MPMRALSMVVVLALVVADGAWAQAAASLTPAQTVERIHVLDHRDSAGAAFKWSAGAVGAVSALSLFYWLLELTGHNLVLSPPWITTIGPLPDSVRNGWIGATVGGFLLAGACAVVSALITSGVDAERAELERQHWIPRTDAEERRALGLTDDVPAARPVFDDESYR